MDAYLGQNQLEELLRSPGGDSVDLAHLIPVAYEELRMVAHAQLARERVGHTLDTTALVHETFLRLSSQRRLKWENRRHFFAAAAKVMRRILVDYARQRVAEKRGGPGLQRALAPESPGVTVDERLPILDDALNRLARLDERQAQVVELRYFAGLSIEETADALDVSPSTVKNEWAMAKAWLRRELTE
ncbi:MAG: sigma-70 family RNA polymerase sigma factor [Bryobacterales bacterium]|nr:sigma-70 family RNA polymerase sigma factor [Bryobacterales bacterium]